MGITLVFPVGFKPVLKHGDHDQSSHGSWATGITGELSQWNPKDSVPASPRNAGGMTEKIWDNWEHGPDGNQYVELYRQYAGEALGISVPKSDMDIGGQLNYLTERGFGGSSTDTARNQTEAMLKAIANGKPEQPTLYRGMVVTDETSQELIKEITSLKAGDTLDMPLVSTTRSLGVASWYALDRSARGTDSVIMKIQDGAKGVSFAKENSRYPQDHEVITSGKFEVVGISKIETPYWRRETLQPRENKFRDGTTNYEIVGTKEKLGDPKKVYETVTSGNWKSLETATFKLTDDRRNDEPKLPILSAWVKQPAREVTVVEVKFVDSHVVQKADAKDYGFTFDALFNTIPFIRDEEDIEKHGDHIQLDHGNREGGGSESGKVSPKTIKTIIERLSETKTPGVTIDLRTGKEPKTGFICSKKGFEKSVKLQDFDADKKKIIEDYIDKNIEELNEKGAHFGGWVVNAEDTVYLDVSRKFDTRQDAVEAMFDNEQEAIYDVKNDSYIYRKDEKDARANKAIHDRSTNSYQRYDQARKRRFYRKDIESDRRKPLNENAEHICLGRFTNLEKHGDHDQATHGSWAAGRFPQNSVSKARNGAKDYAYQKGIKQDDTIDYTKVVANRERASKIADVYESLPKMDRDAIDEYESLSTEVEEQFDFMTKELGIKVEFVKDDPYKTSKEMFDDASKGILKVLSTASTGAHPLFSDNQNDKFRAVHDYFGHAATGRGFGQDGEEAAWVHHSQMFTDKARGALTTETRGQNSFYNNRGKQFADQKVALLPEEFWKVPVSFAKKYTTIYFDYGLKPVLKHDGHEDQSSHGNWATGRSAEDVKRISEFRDRGPTLSTLDEAISEATGEIDRDKAEMMIDNDSFLNQEVEERIDSLILELEEQDGEPMSEEARLANYDSFRNQVVQEFIEGDPDGLEDFSISNGYGSMKDSESSDILSQEFQDVYGLQTTAEFRDGDRQGETITLASSVTEVLIQGNEIMVKTAVEDDQGNSVSTEDIVRVFSKDESSGTWSVEHQLLKIGKEYRGLGFGGQFLQQSEDYYVAKGLTHITLNAGLQDGARHWANSGFDWNRDELPSIVRTLSDAIESRQADINSNRTIFNPESIKIYEEDLQKGREILGRMVDSNGIRDMREDDFPTPKEFASLGADRPLKSSSGGTSWSGKELLRNEFIPYMKILTAEGQNLLSGPIDMDGDGLVYDGTPREKPVSSVGKK